MKIRVTIMTENDEHVDEQYTDERIVIAASKAWDMILQQMTKGLDERGYVEKCEVVER